MGEIVSVSRETAEIGVGTFRFGPGNKDLRHESKGPDPFFSSLPGNRYSGMNFSPREKIEPPTTAPKPHHCARFLAGLAQWNC